MVQLAFINDFCGGDGLAGVALGVVGAVDQEAADTGGQRFSPHSARLFEVGSLEGANAAQGIVDPRSKFSE